jgi:hypothetical protein
MLLSANTVKPHNFAAGDFIMCSAANLSCINAPADDYEMQLIEAGTWT